MKTNYFLQNINPHTTQQKIVYNNQLTQNIENALKQKNILISNLIFSEKKETNTINLDLFYRTNKLKYYRNKIKKIKSTSSLVKKDSNLILNLFQKNNLNVKIRNLNLLIRKKRLIRIFKKYKFFSTKLFNKRFNLFGDFIKVLTLFKQKKASPWLLCYLISTTFKSLQKKKHGLFTSFVNQIFKDIILEKNSAVEGIKFIIAGRLKGKPRASFTKITVGKISLNSQNKDIQKTQLHCYTIYGCFGLKLWINYKK